MKKIFILSAEVSGDLLGGKVVKEIKNKNKNIEFIGITGENLRSEGVKSILSIDEISVMGFSEVIPHIFRLLKIINEVSKKIIEYNPDIIFTIDAPDFSFRVIEKLNRSDIGKKIKKIHMVAPSVWAYRKKRAKKISKLIDLLLVFLPFEPPYFEKYNLKTIFIGHPILDGEIKPKNINNKDQKIINICIMAGSRVSEVKRLLPFIKDSVNIISNKYKIKILTLTTSKTLDIVSEYFKKNLKCKYEIFTQSKKEEILFLSDFAIAKSGTNTIELAKYKIPMVIIYKVNFISYILAKILIKIKFANLINILLNKEVIPELIQQKLKVSNIVKEMDILITNKDKQDFQIKNSKEALNMLKNKDNMTAAKKAANEILKCL